MVADTNVIVSALLWAENESRILPLAEKGEIELLTSLALLDELKKVLVRRRFGLNEKGVDDAVKYILTLSKVVLPKRGLEVICEDQAGNRILECAVEGRARYVVSGDMHLLRLGKFKGIKILRLKEFLKILGTMEKHGDEILRS